MAGAKNNLYQRIIVEVFNRTRVPRATRFEFSRDDLIRTMERLGLPGVRDEQLAAKNIGDILYTFRFRRAFPKEILNTAPPNKMWIIIGKGDALYEFRLITTPTLMPDENLFVSKIHDATPEIVRRFSALNDEQAVLARIRYNRLIDLFCRCVSFSLQNHLRTKVKGIGQIEIDELYVGANRQGEHFIIPVQVKTRRDRLGVSQLLQDLEYCRNEHSEMQARAIGAQMFPWNSGGQEFDRIALIEFACEDLPDDVRITKVAERHFVLLPASEIKSGDFGVARTRSEEDNLRL